MKDYLKMVIFVLILGVTTATVLTGMDALTRERIEENQLIVLQDAILEASGITDYDDTISTFEANLEVIEAEGKTFYIDGEGRVSYTFEGLGVWGPIFGVITLEADFETIAWITVIDQEETPGLGGVVEERTYLDNYVGTSMYPELRVSRTADADDINEVDAIAGGTRTSERFEAMLNEAYQAHRDVWLTLQESAGDA